MKDFIYCFWSVGNLVCRLLFFVVRHFPNLEAHCRGVHRIVCCNSFPVLVCPMVSILSFLVICLYNCHLSFAFNIMSCVLNIAYSLVLQYTCFIYFLFCPVSVLVFCARLWSFVPVSVFLCFCISWFTI